MYAYESMPIPVNLLETLTVFARERTVEAAARAMRTTQPTITRQLQQLQSFVRFPLFEMRGRKKHLTRFGEQLAGQLSARFRGISDSVRQVELTFSSASSSLVRVGARKELLRRYFGRKEFACNLELVSMSGTEITNSIQAGNIDIAISKERVSTEIFVAQKLFKDEYILIVPKIYFEGSHTIESFLKSASRLPLATYQNSFQEIYGLMQNMGFTGSLRDNFCIDDWETIENRVEVGINWSIVPNSFLRKNPSYRCFPTGSSSSSEFYLYYRKNLRKLDWFKGLIDTILQN
jgi:DNA-binding transcriptional LysR family regulator